MKLQRWISFATLGISILTLVLVLKRPAPVAAPLAAATVAANAQSFQEKVNQLAQPKTLGDAATEVRVTPGELSAALSQAAGMMSATPTATANTSSGNHSGDTMPNSSVASPAMEFPGAVPNIKDYQVSMDGRRVSIEREHAADDMVLSAGWDRPRYADALVRVAELSAAISCRGAIRHATVVGIAGTSPTEFKQRVLRLLDDTQPPKLQLSRMGVLASLLVIAAAGIFVAWSHANHSESPQLIPQSEVPVANIPDDPSQSDKKIHWKTRVVPVLSSMSEDAIDPMQRVTTFAKSEDVAFVVEVENISDKPIKLLDTRHGEGYGDSTGKANSDWLGPFLFSILLFDGNGRPIERPEVQVFGLETILDHASVVSLEPGQTHRYLLRPSNWPTPLAAQLQPGRYRAEIRYLGVPDSVANKIRASRTRPQAVLTAMAGDIPFPQVSFEVRAPSLALKQSENSGVETNEIVASKGNLVWGETTNGLCAAAELMPREQAYAHGAARLRLHIQNVSHSPISLTSPLAVPDLAASVKNDQGEPLQLGATWYTGIPRFIRVTLKPQQSVMLDAGNVGLANTKEQTKIFENFTYRTLVAPAGNYTIELEGHFGNRAFGQQTSTTKLSHRSMKSGRVN